MEGSLYNPGFLGGSFNWWIGQIADDSTWRDNIVPGKYSTDKAINGWGYRYKVRIIGYHDQDVSKSIPNDQLPWAQVMYPITAGGGQGQSLQTPNLRQGNFVFGFFLDGPDGQNPVIMGVLGNNAQTALGTSIGDKGFVPTSGYAKGTSPDPNIKAPDYGLKVEKPSPSGTPPSSPKPGVTLDKYGRDPSRPPTKAELAAAQSARADADKIGLTGEARERLIAERTVAATRQEASAAASPQTPPSPGATLESPTNVHQTTAADVARHDKYIRKTPLSSPCEKQKTDLKNIQVVIENLTNDINKIQQAANSYIDAVSNKLKSINVQSLIDNASTQIAKFMKNIFEKVRAYVVKEFNKTIAPAIDKVLPNARFKVLELKDKGTEKLMCLFNKIIGKLKDLISKFLSKSLTDSNGVVKNIAPSGTSPKVPICSVESLVGNVLGNTINDITDGVDKAIAPISSNISSYYNNFQTLGGGAADLSGLASGVAGNLTSLVNNQVDAATGSINNAASAATSVLDQATSLIGGMTGNITAALGFINQILQFFSCDDEPKCPSADIHTLNNGAGSTTQQQEPNEKNVEKQAANYTPETPSTQIPFASPLKGIEDLNYRDYD